MNLVIVGHVDHGKSTLIGRLLYDTHSIPEGIFEEVEKICEELGKKIEFAYLLDSLKEEREQNVTIDTTQTFFKTKKRDYIIIDAPGHKEFLKNTITGASLAEAAILIVDANEGIQEQTRRHAYILSMLGIKQVIVVVNKMDLVEYNQLKFEELKKEILEFLVKLEIVPNYVIPISAIKGDCMIQQSKNMAWYEDLTVLDALDTFKLKKSLDDKYLRFPIQDIYKFNEKRILVGRIETGKLKESEEIIFLPSGRRSKIKSIEIWNSSKKEAAAGENIGIVLEEPLFIERGEIICSGKLPKPTNQIKASIFWMSKNNVKIGEKLIFRCATQEVECVLEKIKDKINSSTLKKIKEKEWLEETEIGNVILRTEKPVVIENFRDIESLGRFVLLKEGDSVAGGIINETNRTS